jgi:hypothetical protein
MQTPPWSDEQFELIRGYVTAGCPIPVACEAAGVKWTTAKHWLEKSKKGISPFTEFGDAMRKAQAMHRVGTKLIIMSAAKKGDWRAAAYLEERYERAQEKKREAEALNQPPPEDDTAAAAAAIGDEDDRVVLLYPVPMPRGAHVSQLQLVPGHAIDTEGTDTTNAEEGDHED